MNKDLKIVFMGTPDFAMCSLKELVEQGANVVACFTNPDKPSGRGMKMAESEVKQYAKSQNILIYQPVKLRKNQEVFELLEKIAPDIIVVVAYGKILPKEILDIPKIGCVNVHGSLLPKYRGAAPMQWALINGEKVTGITTMFMDEGMDTGDMLLKEEVEITNEDDFESLHDKMKVVGAKLLVKTLDKIASGDIKRIKQEKEGTIAPMIDKSMTKIDFNKKGIEIYNFVRGLSPVPGTYMEHENSKIYKVYKVEYKEENIEDVPNGQIIEVTKKSLKIKCADGYIDIKRIQPQNGKKMDIAAFLAGNSNISGRFI